MRPPLIVPDHGGRTEVAEVGAGTAPPHALYLADWMCIPPAEPAAAGGVDLRIATANVLTLLPGSPVKEAGAGIGGRAASLAA